MDASTLGSTERAQVQRNEVADCTLVLSRPIACDVTDVEETTRFVIVDDYEIRGGGIVREALSDRHHWMREKVQVRDAKWEPSAVALEQRVARFAQRPGLVVITGDTTGERRKALARELEADLFARGRMVYFVGIANILYGVDADLERDEPARFEHVRRLAEIAHLMLDAGFILVITAANLSSDDLDVIRAAAPAEAIIPVWLGDSPPPHHEAALVVKPEEPLPNAVRRIEGVLAHQGILLEAP
jgi:bifunctional enzyme CysN/CysC